MADLRGLIEQTTGTEIQVDQNLSSTSDVSYNSVSTETIIQDTLNTKGTNQSLNDGSSIDLPDSTNGIGQIQVGDNEEWAIFRWSSDATVSIITGSGNIATSDTDTKFCIFDNGTSVRIRNRLGSAKIIKLKYDY